MGRGSSKAGGAGAGGGKFKVITDAERFKDDGTLDSQVDAVTHYKQWQKDLSVDQTDAVSLYTGSWHEYVNDHLRSGKALSGYDAQNEQQLHDALNKSVIDKPITVYRGSSADLMGGVKDMKTLQSLVGGTVTDKGYTSTSVSKNGTFGGSIAYKIIVPPGKGRGAYVRGISGFKNEKEFLLNKGTKFKIVSVGQSKSMSKPVVTLQVMD